MEYNRQLNHLEDLIEIRDACVAEVRGGTYNLTVPQRGIWGTAGIGGLNINTCVFLPLCCQQEADHAQMLKLELSVDAQANFTFLHEIITTI